MAKTIKEKLSEELKLYRNFSPAKKAIYIEGFYDGANHVLEEIESILDAPISYVVESGWQGQLNDLVGMIRHKINELKGM